MNTSNNVKYISDVIGQDYQTWKPGDIVLITASTGSGKSFFVLHTLLKRAVERKEKILYLVNRRILQKQLEEELQGSVENELLESHERFMGLSIIEDYIKISTYQNIEQKLIGSELAKTIKFLKSFSIIVCDEAHYFYEDSNFNTNTSLSYDCLRKEFDDKIQIFMSATMERMEHYIKIYSPIYLPFSGTAPSTQIQLRNLKKERVLKYEVPIDYTYIKLRGFKNVEGLGMIIQKSIEDSTEKWLIFVDSIERGKAFRKQLIQNNNIDVDDVVFIDADYQKNDDAQETISELAVYKYANKRIVVSTAVIDNGVSFHDKSLRNMVILADTRETFIQMLGRKRRDNAELNLYICKREQNHFLKRLKQAEQSLEFYKCHTKTIKKMYIRSFGTYGYWTVNPYTDLYFRTCPWIKGMQLTGTQKKTDENEGMRGEYKESWYNYFRFMDYGGMLENQQSILTDIWTSKTSLQSAKRMCYFVRGIIAINYFSIERLRNLKKYYWEMAKAVDANEGAFLNQQAKWLNIPINDICEIEKYSEDIINEQYRNKLKKALEEELVEGLEKLLSETSNKKFKEENIDGLMYFLERDKEYKISETRDLKKKDRPISYKIFNRCMKSAMLPYAMHRDGTMQEPYRIAYTDKSNE